MAQDDDPSDLGLRGMMMSAGAEQAFFNRGPTPRAPTPSTPTPSTSTARPASSPRRVRPQLARGHDVVPLTASTSLWPIGSRFLPLALPHEPLCAVALPPPLGESADVAAIDRFMLLGTVDGLTLLDVTPDGGSGPSVTLEGARCSPVWTGMSVFSLDIVPPSAAHSDGILIALVSSGTDDRVVRLWPLAAIRNLVAWRVAGHDAAVPPVDLSPSTSLGRSVSSQSAKRANGIRRLFGGGERDAGGSIVSAPMAGPLLEVQQTASMPGTLPRGSRRTPVPTPSDEDSGFVFVPSAHAPPRSPLTGPVTNDKHSKATRQAKRSTGSLHDSLANAVDADGSSVAHSWATSSISIVPPRANTAILFVSLLESDARPFWLHLAVATRSSVFLYESRPSSTPTWVLAHEAYVPDTPMLVELVRIKDEREPRLFVAMRDGKAVAVRLEDMMVDEVVWPAKDQAKWSSILPEPQALRRAADDLRASMGSKRSSVLDVVGTPSPRRPSIVRSHWITAGALQLPSATAAATGVGRDVSLCTVGSTTHIVQSPLKLGLAQVSLRPLASFVWPAAIHRLVALYPVDTDDRLVLVGVTEQGLEVRESRVSPPSASDPSSATCCCAGGGHTVRAAECGGEARLAHPGDLSR